MIKEIPLRCPDCGPLVLRVREDEPRVYRFCPMCGQRALFWSDDAFILCPLLPVVRRGERMNRPIIVCLCGSTRFYAAFQEANYRETMAGRIVLSIGFYPHSSTAAGHGDGIGHDSTEKIALDELHKRKIDLADEILVLNVGGYIGSSTRSEIEYARAIGKGIRYLEE